MPVSMPTQMLAMLGLPPTVAMIIFVCPAAPLAAAGALTAADGLAAALAAADAAGLASVDAAGFGTGELGVAAGEEAGVVVPPQAASKRVTQSRDCLSCNWFSYGVASK